jgi:hypothetical protein
MKASKIYDLLVEMNEGKPDQPEAYLDPDTNTVWILLGEGRMLTFWCPDRSFEEMSDKEINDFITDILSE